MRGFIGTTGHDVLDWVMKSVVEVKLNAPGTISLTKYEQNILREMFEILSPFEEVTDYVQKQNYVLISYMLPCIRDLRIQLNELSEKYKCKMV